MLPLRLLRRALQDFTTNPICSQGNLIRQLKSSSFVLRNSYSSNYYVDSPLSSVEIPNLTINNYILNNVEKWPEKTAMECGISGRKYTYSQLKTLSKNVALGLLNSGLQPGQVITIILPNMPEFIIAMIGALQAGLIVSTVNPLYNADEIRYQLLDSESSLVITYQQKINDVNEAINKIENNKLFPTVVINNPSDSLPQGTRSFRELLETRNNDETLLKGVKSDPDSTAFLLYSSGTTGLPKGVILSHRQIVSNCEQLSHPALKIAYETSETYQDVVMCILPLFHCYGLSVNSLSNLYCGTKLITLPKFEPESFLKLLKEVSSCTIAYFVPPLIQFLANNPSVTAENMKKLRSILNGAAAISVTDAHKLLSKKHMIINSGYGMTEAGPVITACRNTCVDLDTVGIPLSNSQLKIVDIETGETLDPSQPGEICCKGPQVMSGYYKNEEATAATLKDGWLHTGDVGYLNEERHLFIVDRMKELIKVKGFQVAPLELEETLRQHPGVSDVAVVGKPDSRYGEVPVAFIVPTPGKEPTEKELLSFIATKVAEYKQINSVIFMTSIPKNTTGKILRKTLKET
uniref:Luciferin 4-monooxygenase n=1 Tax=Rhodnius prolixus TaxID=13249 RepID=T1H7X8_RHOPR